MKKKTTFFNIFNLQSATMQKRMLAKKKNLEGGKQRKVAKSMYRNNTCT